jgi:DNA-binding HxlR family transcriptional regulator
MVDRALDPAAPAPQAPEQEVVRAGSRTLSIFAYSLNARVLRAHADGRLLSRELEESIGWAPPTSLRVATTNLCELGVLARVELESGSPGVATDLTVAGRALLPVLDVLERWLQLGPDGALTLDDPAARGVVKVLTTGWDSAMVRTLAERPLTLNELSTGIPDFSYPSLKRRLAKLRSTHLVAPIHGGKTAAFVATDWLRCAVAPLAAAARWELEHDPGAEPISRFEVEAAFLLALPLVPIPKRASGRCTFAVLIPADDGSAKPQVAGVAVEVDRGTLVSCRPGDGLEPDTWAFGSALAWLEAVINGRLDGLRLKGAATPLVKGVVKGINAALYGS